MSRHEQLPISRGFDSSLAMLAGAADHYTNKRSCGKGDFVDMWLNTAPAKHLNGTYSEFRYVEHALAAIRTHNASQPFFLYMAFQNVHGPTEAPSRFLDIYNDSIFEPRRNGLAQISAVDEGIANLTGALKAKGMWDSTLVVFSSDNGGPGDHENNYPLRGSKGSDFEGGVRVVAFVSGGWLPSHMRGTAVQGMVHIADWYATFASLAGVHPEDTTAVAAGLPPIDSLDMSAMLTGANGTSPRTELALSYLPEGNRAMISGRYKFILNAKTIPNGFFPGPTTPNGTDFTSHVDCSFGCLFNLEKDEVEHHDLAATSPKLVASLTTRLEAIGATLYQSPGGKTADRAAVVAAESVYGGFWGPWEGVVVPTPAPRPPVTGGFQLVHGSLCLRANSLGRGSDLETGACDGHAQWDEDGDGRLYNVAGENAFRFIRPSDHHPTCTEGHGTRLGEITSNGIAAILNGSRLVFTTCSSKCVGTDARVLPCNEAAAEGWQKNTVIVV